MPFSDLCPTILNRFYKVWFSGVLRSPWVTWCIKNPEKSGFREKTGFLCPFSTFGRQFSTDFSKVWFYGFLRSPWVTWCIKNPEKSGFRKKPDPTIFRIFSEMVSMRDFEIKWLNTPRFGIRWLVFTKSPRIQNLPEARSRAECARSAHEREFLKICKSHPELKFP